MIALRKRYQAFGRGDARVPPPREPARAGLPARATTGAAVLVVANLSRFVQYVELDLSQFRGSVPVELFGPDRVPARSATCRTCSRSARTRSTGSSLEGQREEAGAIASDGVGPRVRGRPAPSTRSPPGAAAASSSARSRGFLPTRRWFAGKARSIRSVSVARHAAHRGATRRARRPGADRAGRVRRGRGRDLLRAAGARGGRAGRAGARSTRRAASWPTWSGAGRAGRARRGPARRRRLPRAARRGAPAPAPEGPSGGQLSGSPTAALARAIDGDEPPEPSIFRAEQSNTSVLFGQSLILKLFRASRPG